MALELFKRSFLTLVVLRFLHERPMYGYEICQAVEEESQGRHVLKYGAVYPLLRELEKNEVIKGEWEASTEGPPRKRFTLLSKGEAVFAEHQEALKDLTHLAGLKVIDDASPA